MTGAIATPSWLAESSQRRLRDISNAIASKAPHSPEYAHSIAEDAAALRQLSMEFLRYANAYTSPILRLSPDLIFEILACVAELEPTKTTTLGWIRLGHVSYAFRSALLNMRELWSSAACNVNLHARDEVLVRAGDTPLSIHLNDDDEDIARDRIEFAMEHLSSARYVKIVECDPQNPLWTLEPRVASGQELPLLEKLDVEAMHRPRRDESWLGTDVYQLQPPHAPRLRCVILTNVFIPFPPGNITTLILNRRKHFPDYPLPNQDAILPSSEQLLSLLVQCVNLEELQLQHMIPDHITPLPPSHYPRKATHLPSLKNVGLYAQMSRIASLWSHLVLPPNTDLALGPDHTGFNNPVVSGGFVDRDRLSFLPLFLEHATQSSCITAFALEVDDTKFLTQCGFFKRKLDHLADSWEGVPVYAAKSEQDAYTPFIDIWFHQCVWDDHVSLRDFIHSIPIALFDGIVAADIDTRGLSVQDMQLVFSRLPYTHTLDLRETIHTSLVALSPNATPQHATRNETGLSNLRHLQFLHLNDVHLCFNPDKRKEREICMQEMLDMVASRTESGLPLRFLLIEGWCSQDVNKARLHDFVARLRKLVPTVRTLISPMR
ncbi:hypothetical protein PENSPDRAFT_228533 [Peniophora sp. CONT]|nr:hypothetical protein PENSPDRAFT_228533 [Peniophora sp. CONT]